MLADALRTTSQGLIDYNGHRYGLTTLFLCARC